MSTYYNGIRFDHIAKCKKCGRTPEIGTHYTNLKTSSPGDGPFLIKCMHGKSFDEAYDSGELRMARSWYKSRAVEVWRRINKQR